MSEFDICWEQRLLLLNASLYDMGGILLTGGADFGAGELYSGSAE